MRLVIDTNCLIAGLLRSSISRQIILSHQFDLYAPGHLLIEIKKCREYLEKKARTTTQEFDQLLETFMERITLVQFERFGHEFDRALDIMRSVDEKDTAFLAVGMYLELDGIWTEDKDFQKQDVLTVYSTKDLFERLEQD